MIGQGRVDHDVPERGRRHALLTRLRQLLPRLHHRLAKAKVKKLWRFVIILYLCICFLRNKLAFFHLLKVIRFCTFHFPIKLVRSCLLMKVVPFFMNLYWSKRASILLAWTLGLTRLRLRPRVWLTRRAWPELKNLNQDSSRQSDQVVVLLLLLLLLLLQSWIPI